MWGQNLPHLETPKVKYDLRHDFMYGTILEDFKILGKIDAIVQSL